MRYSFPLLVLLPSVAVAADYPKLAKPDAAEPAAKSWSPETAAAALDAAGVNWTRDRGCVTCHTNLPYLMSRPHLKGDAGWKEVRKFFADEVADWARTGKTDGDVYVVATATGLAFADAHVGKLSEETKQAFERMWAAQRKTGEWNWLKCDWPPLEHDDYYGAVLAALAVGTAPENYASSEAARPGVDRLRAYFARTPAPDLHHRTMLVWASVKLPGLLSADEQAKVVTELKAKQRSDGGWALPALGQYSRRDAKKTPNDPAAPSDGYATGLAVYVLRQAGAPAKDPAVANGVRWLKSNQRVSGRWYTRSLNTDKAHYIANAGTAFAVMALAACGEPVAAR